MRRGVVIDAANPPAQTSSRCWMLLWRDRARLRSVRDGIRGAGGTSVLMSVKHSVVYFCRRALACGVLAACGAGTLATHGQQANTASQQVGTRPTTQATTNLSTSAKSAAKAPTVKALPATDPILLAQATPPPATTTSGDAGSSQQLQTVVVTGTLIARPAAETAEAITVIQASALKNEGLVNVEQAVDQIASNVPSTNIALSVSTFTGGGSYANLRGLGTSRTLVLLDGQRLAYNVVLGNAGDLSGIQ